MMAISFPLPVPTNITPTAITFTPRSSVIVSSSPFTYEQEVFDFQGQQWQMDVELPPMQRADAEEWVAWLLSLNGQYGTFTMGDPVGITPRGSAVGTPVVDGAGQQRSATLDTRGWTISTSNVLSPGDYIQVGNHMYKVLAQVDSDGSGNATIDVWPRVRDVLTDGQSITTSNVTGIWRLKSNEMPWDVSGAQVYGISFTAMEAL